jgi:putative ABC transport system ATP-binding protein
MMLHQASDHEQAVLPKSIILARALTRIYRLGATEVVGLNQVDLEIPAGQLVVLKGESGSGKSTLLSLLAGLDRPTSGQLNVAGIDLDHPDDKKLTRFRREVVGMVFQSFNLLPTLSVVENICLPALFAGASLKKTEMRAGELLDWLGMAHRLHHLPSQLSGGEMQRTAIARALINRPAIVLADEPTGNLDRRNGQAVIELLAEMNRTWGTTVVIATHSGIADHLATMQLYLEDGKTVQWP